MQKCVGILWMTFILMTLRIFVDAQPQRVIEIPHGSTSFRTIGDYVYFVSGDSLLRTDGTAEGTILLKTGLDFFEDRFFLSPFLEFNGMLFFLDSVDFLGGKRIWRSDGTPEGTILLKDGLTSVPLFSFHEFGGLLYFLDSGSFTGGRRLWRTDGTLEGTILLKTSTAADINVLADAGGYVIFQASDDETGQELYRTNGTPDGTLVIKDINLGPANGFAGRGRVIGNEFFFGADNGTQGIELWKTDGSSGGTVMVKDINPGPSNGFVNTGRAVSDNNRFYFAGFTEDNGAEPWVSDGTEDGTQLLHEVEPGPNSVIFVNYIADFNGFLYFTTSLSQDQFDGAVAKLWKTDGSDAGTSFIHNLCDGCQVDRVLFYHEKLYILLQFFELFSLWGTDGTPEGTQEVYSELLDGSVNAFQILNDVIFFYTTTQGNSNGFYRSDGTPGGTTRYWQFRAFGRSVINLARVNDLVYFADHDGPSDEGHAIDPEDAWQLMQTDGFTTVSLRNIFGISFKGTANIVNYNGKVLFTTQNDDFGSTDTRKKLWIYDPNEPRENTASFTLVNADTDEDIQTLTERDTITKPANTHFNIRYNPVGSPGSVVFKHQDKVVRIENSAPFSLRGDYSGNYLPWEAGVADSHKVEATPYSEAGGKGTAGTTLTINFTIEEGSEECLASGTILREFWAGAPGAGISHVPLDTEPTSTSELAIFEGPENIGTNYATRIRGYICPPATGNYIFWIASNDHSELWLSADDNPGNKIRIAHVTGATTPRQWNKFASQRSDPVTLQQGNRYYIEALHKQGVGMDHISVGWQLPDGTMERPIPGNRLSPFESEANTIASDVDAPYSQINIYPNPAQSGDQHLTVSGYEGFEDSIETHVQIMNMTGDVFFAEKISCGGGCSAHLMTIQKQLVPGVYVVKFTTQDVHHSKRLLVK